MTAANRHIFGRATRRKPRFLASPKTPLLDLFPSVCPRPRPKLCPYFCPLASGQKYGQSCGWAVDKHRTSGRKAGFSGTPEIEVSCVSPAQKYDSWLQSCLYFTKFQESASRAVLGGTRYPLYFKNWVFLRDFQRGFASNPPPCLASPWRRRRRRHGLTVERRRSGFRSGENPTPENAEK